MLSGRSSSHQSHFVSPWMKHDWQNIDVAKHDNGETMEKVADIIEG